MEFSGAAGRSQAKMEEPTLVSLAVPKSSWISYSSVLASVYLSENIWANVQHEKWNSVDKVCAG